MVQIDKWDLEHSVIGFVCFGKWKRNNESTMNGQVEVSLRFPFENNEKLSDHRRFLPLLDHFHWSQTIRDYLLLSLK